MLHLNELGDKSLVKLLLYFIKNPSKEATQADIRKSLKIAKATLIKNLNKLEDCGGILVKRHHQFKTYKLDNNNIMVKQLKIVHTLNGLDGIIRYFIKHELNAFLYGSSARGEDFEDSDIDIIIIGRAKLENIIADIRRFSESIGKDIKIKVFSHLQLAGLSRNDRPFYERFEKDKIKLN